MYLRSSVYRPADSRIHLVGQTPEDGPCRERIRRQARAKSSRSCREEAPVPLRRKAVSDSAIRSDAVGFPLLTATSVFRSAVAAVQAPANRASASRCPSLSGRSGRWGGMPLRLPIRWRARSRRRQRGARGRADPHAPPGHRTSTRLRSPTGERGRAMTPLRTPARSERGSGPTGWTASGRAVLHA
jgi:hypothetical protein